MAHKILKSLAGTNQQYVVVSGNEGFRIRKLGKDKCRIHIEKKAPGIDSRDRPPSMRDIPYWAADVSSEGLLRALGVALHGSEDHYLVPKVDSLKGKPPEGIESVMASLNVEYSRLGEERETLSKEVQSAEKRRQDILDKRKELLSLKTRLGNGMVAYVEAREALK